MLVPERFPSHAAALANPVGELDHLVDRLLAVEPHDVLEGHPPRSASVSPGKRGKHFGEHRHHHLGPALANQR